MSSPDCKRQKLEDDVNSVANMSNGSPTKDSGTQTDDATSTVSACNRRSVISIIAQSFADVAKLEGFVDRTMLVKELLEYDPSYAMMFAPSKFGKTVNLSMIRLFCDIEDKNTKTKEDVTKDPTMQELRSNPSKNMKVFLRQFEGTQYEECLILKEEKFVVQHFGRHPVVYFNFKNCKPKNESEALYEFAKLVRNGYEENDYLQNSKELKSAFLKNTCTAWPSYNNDDLKSLFSGDVIDGLESLIKSLRIHWGRKPVFLVDEIDKPCAAAMQCGLRQRVVCDIGRTISDVLCSILKSENQLLKLQAALLTGICKFKYSGLSPVDNTMKVYFLSDDRFSKYYGLTAAEVRSLVTKFFGPRGDAEVERIIEDINAKYNGYYQSSSSGENKEYARYCLFSVLNYIREINEDKENVKLCFWTDGGCLTGPLMPMLKKSDVIMSGVRTLLHSDSGTIAINFQSEIDIGHLIGLFREEIHPDRGATFSFFLQRGFLARNLEKRKEKDAPDNEIYVKIPNLEIKDIYRQMFMIYHDQLPEPVKSKLTSCGEIFKLLPTFQNSAEFQKSLDQLCENLKCIFRSMQCGNEASICSHMLTILKYYADYEKGEVEYAVEYINSDNKKCRVYIDVWGRHGNFAVIFEVKYNSDASSEPGKIGSKAKSSLAAAEDIVKLLPNKTYREDNSGSKAGTGKDLNVLKPSGVVIEHYILIGMAVDGDHTTHMLVFRDTTDWEKVIQVNPENHVAELISTHLKSKQLMSDNRTGDNVVA